MLKNKTIQSFILGIIFVLISLFSGMSIINVVNANDTNLQISKTLSAKLEPSQRYEVKQGASIPEDFNDLGSYAPTFEDNILFDMLLKIYKSYNPTYNSNYLRIDMFKDFTKLDLSNMVSGTNNIINLKGLNYLNLQSLEVLDLSKNNIEYFDVSMLPGVTIKIEEGKEEERKVLVDEFSPVRTLKTLNLSNNNLVGPYDFSDFNKLVNLDISNNEITKVKFLRTQESVCVLNYSNNKIKNFDDLVLPQFPDVKLILFGNPLGKVNAIPHNIKLEIGILNLTNNIDSQTLLHFIQFETLNIDTKIYKKKVTKDGENEIVTFEAYDFNPQNKTNFMFTLPTDNYKIEYVNKDNDEIISSKEFTVKPPIANYYYIIKGKKYNEYNDKINGKASIHFEVPNENIKVYYAYSDGDWIEGNVCDLKKQKGHTVIRYKTVENGIESEVYQIFLQLSFSRFMPDVVIIVIIIASIVFLALVGVPLFKKLLDKIGK